MVTKLIAAVVLFLILRSIMKALFGGYINQKKEDVLRRRTARQKRFQSDKKIDDADFEEIK